MRTVKCSEIIDTLKSIIDEKQKEVNKLRKIAIEISELQSLEAKLHSKKEILHQTIGIYNYFLDNNI